MFPGVVLEEDKIGVCVLEEIERGVEFPLNEAEFEFAHTVPKGELPKAPRDGVPDGVVIRQKNDSVRLFEHSIPLGITQRECKSAVPRLVSRMPGPQDLDVLTWRISPESPWLFSIVPAESDTDPV